MRKPEAEAGSRERKQHLKTVGDGIGEIIDFGSCILWSNGDNTRPVTGLSEVAASSLSQSDKQGPGGSLWVPVAAAWTSVSGASCF